VTSPPRAGGDLTRFSPGRDLKYVYGHHMSDPRQERAFVGTAAFFVTFALTRAITHAIRAGRGPFRNLSPGGRHIHHMTFGITALLITGYLWMNEIGIGLGSKKRRASRITAGMYGAGGALTLDEFALWLNLEDDYWTKKGRESIDAVVLFGSTLLLAALGRNLVKDLVTTALLPRRSRALHRARRIARRHPRAALQALASTARAG